MKFYSRIYMLNSIFLCAKSDGLRNFTIIHAAALSLCLLTVANDKKCFKLIISIANSITQF